MNWTALWQALALVLVIEGLLPALNPQGMRRSLLLLAQLETRVLRAIGLASMLLGALLLYLLH